MLSFPYFFPGLDYAVLLTHRAGPLLRFRLRTITCMTHIPSQLART